MSMNTKLGRALVAGAALMMVFPMTGCRKKMADESTGIKAEILYQTYCEDSFKGYQMDNTAALTFYTDGTWSTAHCNGLNNYRTDIGTWEVSDDGVLSMYNADGELVGNGSDSVDPSDVTTWTKWGAGYFNNGDGTETQLTVPTALLRERMVISHLQMMTRPTSTGVQMHIFPASMQVILQHRIFWMHIMQKIVKT